MPCETIRDEHGQVTMILCSRSRRQTCKFCGMRPVSKLCDFPVGPHGKTCDAGICDRCATSIAYEVDYCPTHKNQKPAAQQTSLFTETR